MRDCGGGGQQVSLEKPGRGIRQDSEEPQGRGRRWAFRPTLLGHLVSGQIPQRACADHLCKGPSRAATACSRLWQRSGSPRGARAACPQRSNAGQSTSLAAEECGLMPSARTSAWDAEDVSVRSRDSAQPRDHPGQRHQGQHAPSLIREEDTPHNLRRFPDRQKHFGAARMST